MWHYPKVVICGDEHEKDKDSACEPNRKSYAE